MARMDMTGISAAAALPEGASAQACYELGLMHACGRDAPLDYVAAHKWFNVALARGYQPAAERRRELAGEMSAEQIAEALREARAFLTRH